MFGLQTSTAAVFHKGVSQRCMHVVQDTTFEMERQRNKPVKYNRELVHKSVKAMQKVEEVRLIKGCCQYST